ncbi:MAG: glycosyltransferase family 2 protein [Pseudomonadaceae bacterium]|nr:glycosyltransferase family 2 protein [Pseudomonadaceae bacterium]
MINNNQPPISIGISFYNAELTLLDAVRSIFAQTHQNWELILVDDGSTDRSLEIAQSINDPRVRIYSDGENLRLAARLNQITKLAKYDFLARMDADDLISPVRLEKQINILLSQPDVDLVTTGICSLSDDYKPVGFRCVTEEHVITANGLLSGASGIVHASLLGRRDWFVRNPYKESMLKSQDTNLWVRSYSKNDLSVAFLREPLYYYREDGNVTKKQLLLAYEMGRHTILADAKAGFNLSVKTRKLIDNLIKTLAVKLFTKYALKLARNRRNAELLDVLVKESINNEISFIRSIALPLSAPGRKV